VTPTGAAPRRPNRLASRTARQAATLGRAAALGALRFAGCRATQNSTRAARQALTTSIEHSLWRPRNGAARDAAQCIMLCCPVPRTVCSAVLLYLAAPRCCTVYHQPCTTAIGQFMAAAWPALLGRYPDGVCVVASKSAFPGSAADCGVVAVVLAMAAARGGQGTPTRWELGPPRPQIFTADAQSIVARLGACREGCCAGGTRAKLRSTREIIIRLPVGQQGRRGGVLEASSLACD